MHPSGLVFLDGNKTISLREYLQNNASGILALPNILHMVIEEVAMLHDMGLIHGDIKSSRIHVIQTLNVSIV